MKTRKIIALLLTGVMLIMLPALTACDQSQLHSMGAGVNEEDVNSDDYTEIYRMIRKLNNRENSLYSRHKFRGAGGANGAVEREDYGGEDYDDDDFELSNFDLDENASSNSSPQGESSGNGDEDKADFSETNNQVDGVQESDIVKTDGTNIYVARTSYSNSGFSGVFVVKADNGEMEEIASIKLRNFEVQEMLLYNNRLIIIWNNMFDDETTVEVYETEGDFKEPISTYSQKGYFSSSRMIGSNIYLITTFNPQLPRRFSQDDLVCYVPSFTENGERRFVPSDGIALPEELDRVQYTVIGGLDINKSDMAVSVKSKLGSTETVYSSMNNIYVISTVYKELGRRNYWGYETNTVIDKFSLNKGRVEIMANTTLRGSARNQFHFDEYKGVLRVITEAWGIKPSQSDFSGSGTWKLLDLPKDKGWWDEQAHWGEQKDYDRDWGLQGGILYTLCEDLNVLSEIHRIGFGENVHSVRFMGDVGYVVTFWQTDPLFSFDLSDPLNPVQLDELKIPGFSRYLHSWSDGLLLGMGVNTDDNGVRFGLKMTMFDVSDNEDLIEKDVELIGDDNRFSWYWSPVEDDHRAALVVPEKNIVGFPYYGEEAVYAVFEYNHRRGFELLGEIKMSGEHLAFQRGLYIGDYIYAVSEDMIVSAELRTSSIREVDRLKLK
jgi:uncharacterized secreted protein with C-terminal beta-propeller domain